MGSFERAVIRLNPAQSVRRIMLFVPAIRMGMPILLVNPFRLLQKAMTRERNPEGH